MMSTSQNYANEKSFNLYVNYLAIKKHFTTDSYNYHKYNGKIRASFDKFVTRPDVYFFFKLSKMDSPQDVLLANMIANPNSWIRDIVEETGERNYIEWRKRMDSLSYIFKNDLNKLAENYQSNFAVHNGQHPYLISLYLQKQITLETLTILSSFANIYDYWNENVVDKIVARDIIRLSRKYRPFLEFSEKKFKEYVRNHFF
jgi:hypothetical protein